METFVKTFATIVLIFVIAAITIVALKLPELWKELKAEKERKATEKKKAEITFRSVKGMYDKHGRRVGRIRR